MPFLVPGGAFAQALDEVAKLVGSYGTLDALDEGGRHRRRVSFVLTLPGYGLPTQATLEYSERYRRTDQGWLREGYRFEYRTVDPRSRRAHHQHGRAGIHQHCEPTGGTSRDHYEDVERLLLPTHEDFSALWTHGEPVRCLGLKRKRRS